VRKRTRTFSHAAANVAAEDPQLLQVIGEVSSAAFVATAAVQRVSDALQAAHDSAISLRDGEIGVDEDEAANDAAELASAQAQVALTPLVLNAISHAFDSLAASGTSQSKNLDRHWRNARTAGSHNPWVFKARLIGDLAVNGAELPRVWAIGASK
jgi:alkylation response protein AidB-like acyl-CoA dehydrogenase